MKNNENLCQKFPPRFVIVLTAFSFFLSSYFYRFCCCCCFMFLCVPNNNDTGKKKKKRKRKDNAWTDHGENLPYQECILIKCTKCIKQINE